MNFILLKTTLGNKLGVYLVPVDTAWYAMNFILLKTTLGNKCSLVNLTCQLGN